MSDDRNKPPLAGMNDLDWDSALDEWEKKNFTPAVAREAESNAAPPPTESDPKPAGAPPAEPTLSGFAPEGTVIAPVPSELRSNVPASPRSAPPSRPGSQAVPAARPSAPGSVRGGLDQLFSRRPPATAFDEMPSLADEPSAAEPTRQTAGLAFPRLDPLQSEPDVSREHPSVTRQLASQPSLLAALLGEDAETDRTLVKGSASSPATDPVTPAQLADGSSAGLPPDDATAERPALRANRDRPLDTDDEKATLIRKHESLSDAATATSLGTEAPETTRGAPPSDLLPRSNGSTIQPRTSATPRTSAAPDDAVSFEAETPAPKWLDEEKTRAFRARLAWLEEEARLVPDETARARALLAASELAAIVGDRGHALVLAGSARDLEPQLPLAWRQVRQLMDRDVDELVDALDAEASQSPTPSARAHATLYSADILRVDGRGDAAVVLWDGACKLDPTDARAPIARAALALAQNDHTNGALRLADNSELIMFDKAFATALRLRGIERPEAEVDEMAINDGLRHARLAIEAGDVVPAAQSIGEIAAIPELAKGAAWLSAALGAAHIASRRGAARALKTLSVDEPLARRQLAARGIELGDPDLVTQALGKETDIGTFEPAERATLYTLSRKQPDPPSDATVINPLAPDPALAPLEDALWSLSPVMATRGDDENAVARAERVSGSDATRVLTTLGRVLASRADDASIAEVLGALPDPRPASATGVVIEAAARTRRWGELSQMLAALPTESSGGKHHIAAAIVAERAGERERARREWTTAAEAATASDGLLRIAAELDPQFELGDELLRVADEMRDGLAAAVLRLEGCVRAELTEDQRAAAYERVHRTAPALGLGDFLAEQIGRRRGDLDEVVRWLHERRAYATDPLETALDAVREALLVADRDPDLASTRLEEAHRARPDDVALRELHERLAVEPLSDRASWRERRASAATGASSVALWIDAALEHERAGDGSAALRAARNAADAGDRSLSRPLIERAQLAAGDIASQVQALEATLAGSEDPDVRRDALEQLAFVEAFAEKEPLAALARHRTILETTPNHLPSLRWVEHELMTQGSDDETAPIFVQIARVLDGSPGGETTAHAQHAARLRAREEIASGLDGTSAWDHTYEMAALAASQPESSLWALRSLNAHARLHGDDPLQLKTTLALIERTQRPAERAALLLRASETLARTGTTPKDELEQAAREDPGDVVTWGFLAEVRQRAGELRASAEACESSARASVVKEHQLLAWHDAAKIWFDEVKDTERAMTALEGAAEIDMTYADVFPRLSALYAEKNLDTELTRLLEKRLDTIEDTDERVALEVELARAFMELGEIAKAKITLETALEERPDHAVALADMADLCAKEADWAGAEQALVRLARLIADPVEQRRIYERLAELYSVQAPNLPRAEMAYKEVLRRSPHDVAVMTKLVSVYTRQGDVQKAAEAQQEIISATNDPDQRLAALVELAKIHEVVGRDPRRAEQVFDSARKEFPTSVVALRSMAEFYARQRQMPAMQILLDRAASDARRAFAQGRFVPSLFEVLHAAFELRGKRDAARVVAATLAAVEGHTANLVGGEARAVDPRLDEVLAPESMSPPLRQLLSRVGDALDAVAPVDLRSLQAAPLQPGTPVGATVGAIATVVGLGALQILVSPNLGPVALPLATNPPTLLVGEALGRVRNEGARVFVVARAMKMLLARSSALLRTTPQDVALLIGALFTALNPSYVAQGLDLRRVSDIAVRIRSALPRGLDPTVSVVALEAAGMVGTQWATLAAGASAWANRVALVAVGDPSAALEALAWAQGEESVPTGSEERAAWIARHPEARDLMTFSVTDAYSEARALLGLDR